MSAWPDRPVDVLVADPPWLFGDSLPGKSRGASKNYECMSILDLKVFNLPFMAEDSWLFLWRVSSMPHEALDVVRAWGFRPWSELVWRKTTKHGKLHFGMGRSVRASHETCIIARRGRPKPASRSIRSVFDAPVGRHSEKPGEFFRLVEELTGPGLTRVELFARKRREGWFCYGNELEDSNV